MANLSDLLPSGSGGKTADFVASGTLPNGQAVILNSDGTVTAVAESSAAVAPYVASKGSAVVFNAAGAPYTGSGFDPNDANTVIIAYQDAGNSNYGTCVVGTVSGETISFGSKTVFLSANATYTTLEFNPNTTNQFLVTFSDNGNGTYFTAMIGTRSGASLSFSSKFVINSGTTYYGKFAFDPSTTNQFLTVYRDAGNSDYGTARVGLISGSSISYGAEAVFSSSTTQHESVSSDPNTARQFVIGYKVGSPMYALVATTTVSNTVSFGAAATISANVYIGDVSFDTNTANKFVFAYSDAANSYYGTAKAATISGTTITLGTASIINSGTTYQTIISYSNLSPSVFSIAYQDRSNSDNIGLRSGTTSGTTITLGAADILHTGGAGSSGVWSSSLPFSSGGKFCLSYANSISSGAGTAIVGTVSTTAVITNLTATNFVGIPDKAYASGATATVSLQGGVSLNQTSLTIDTAYYVQENGTLGTAADTISVKAGVALSATSLHLDNGTIPAQTGNSGKNLTTDGTTTSWASSAPIEGSAKVWFRYNPSAGTVQASYNITSITDTATGTTDVTIATDFSSANYAIVGTCEDTKFVSVAGSGAPAPATGTFRVFTKDTNGTAADPEALWVVCFGDQS